MTFSSQSTSISRNAGGIIAGTSRPQTMLAEQLSNCIILNCHMQIRRRDRDIRMPCGIANFGESSATGECMRNESVATVVNGECLETFGTENAESGAIPFPKCVSREWFVIMQRSDELIVCINAAVALPGAQVFIKATTRVHPTGGSVVARQAASSDQLYRYVPIRAGILDGTLAGVAQPSPAR